MAKAIEDLGHKAQATKPLALKRYEAGRLPDPGQTVDCLIVSNDRSDGVPRARVAVSNGATFDDLAFRHELESLRDLVMGSAAKVDLMPAIREGVETALRDRTQAVTREITHTIDATPQQITQNRDEDFKTISAAMLELAQHVNNIQFENADLMARLEIAERQIAVIASNGLSRVDVG